MKRSSTPGTSVGGFRYFLIVVAVSVVAACNSSTEPAASAPTPAAQEQRPADPVARGAALYAQHCAACHGARAEGAPNWHRPGADGKPPAPPLDGSGHAWHHPQAQLKQTILDGTQGRGGGMPAWRGKLSEAEVDAVIAWFQSLWPPELYRAWREMDQKAR